jgi:uncharacterized protein YjgD (DUF1641 family)
MTKEEKINSLIANKATKFEETDKEWLNTFSEKELEVLEPKMQRNAEAKEVNVDNVKVFLQDKPMNEVIEMLPQELQANLKAAEEEKTNKINALVEVIMTNTEKDLWKKEELEALNLGQLEKIAKTARVKNADYSAQGVQINRSHSGTGEEPLLPMDVKFENK